MPLLAKPNVVFDCPAGLLILLRQLAQDRQVPVVGSELGRVLHVPEVLHLSHGEQPSGCDVDGILKKTSHVILYIIEGKVRHEFGSGLKQAIENEAGDFIYIKPGVPHEVFNMSDTEPVVAFVARSSADEWNNIIPYERTQNV